MGRKGPFGKLIKITCIDCIVPEKAERNIKNILR